MIHVDLRHSGGWIPMVWRLFMEILFRRWVQDFLKEELNGWRRNRSTS